MAIDGYLPALIFLMFVATAESRTGKYGAQDTWLPTVFFVLSRNETIA